MRGKRILELEFGEGVNLPEVDLRLSWRRIPRCRRSSNVDNDAVALDRGEGGDRSNSMISDTQTLLLSTDRHAYLDSLDVHDTRPAA